jgi:hypothetical protein
MSSSINPSNPASNSAAVQQLYQESLVEQLEQQELDQLEQQQLERQQEEKIEQLVNNTGAAGANSTAAKQAQLNKQQSAGVAVASSRLRI